MKGNAGLQDRESIREVVKEKYGAAALRVLNSEKASCCGSAPSSNSCCQDHDSVIIGNLYDEIQAGEIPEAALLASLGCGNPTALASLAPGEVVLDLGSGGGIDVLLSAKRVGPTGFAYGPDMTAQMLEPAQKNRQERSAHKPRVF